MKIDRRDPRHWLYLALFLGNVLLAMALRPLLHRRRGGRVLLYGHKLAGNLLPILRRLQGQSGPDSPRPAFLTMDPAYHRELRERGEPSVLGISPRAIAWLARADAVVSDHGLHAMEPMLGRGDLKFFDVWHGIPFKGFDAADFRAQRRYDETWVASPLLRDLYVGRFGFDPARVVATGYARTDRLVRRDDDVAQLRRELGLPVDGRCVLFAPTWKQDASERSLYPFGVAEDAFVDALSALCARHDATLVLRTHLNSGDGHASSRPRVLRLPYAAQPDTEGILLACDMLVCDWSSIAFDWLLLDRPTVFLDVPPPFAKGLSLDAGYRYGAIAGGVDELLSLLDRYLGDPEAYRREHGERHAATKARVYGDCADGEAAERCVARLLARLS